MCVYSNSIYWHRLSFKTQMLIRENKWRSLSWDQWVDVISNLPELAVKCKKLSKMPEYNAAFLLRNRPEFFHLFDLDKFHPSNLRFMAMQQPGFFARALEKFSCDDVYWCVYHQPSVGLYVDWEDISLKEWHIANKALPSDELLNLANS